MTSIIYSGNNSYFSQFEFWREVSSGVPINGFDSLSKFLKTKIKNLSHYFENQYGEKKKINKVLLMSEGFDANKIIEKIELEGIPVEKAKSSIPSIDNYDWIPAAGAAKRSFIPRSDDTIISLLPIGTESLYETQKMTSFASSILVVAATMAVFYIAAFIASYFFIFYIGTDLNRQMEFRVNMLMPADYAKIDQETQEFNSYISDLSSVVSRINIDYGIMLEKISSLNSSGVSLVNINFDSNSGMIAVSGIASSRENLAAFKFQLLNSLYFSNVKFSVQNIAQKSNIPFSISFNLK